MRSLIELSTLITKQTHAGSPTASALVMPRLLRSINDVAASDLALVHQVVHLLELGEADGLVRALDQAAAVEVERFGGVLAVADVAALDGDHLDDGLEDGGLEIGAGGETNAYDCAAGADVLLCRCQYLTFLQCE